MKCRNKILKVYRGALVLRGSVQSNRKRDDHTKLKISLHNKRTRAAKKSQQGLSRALLLAEYLFGWGLKCVKDRLRMTQVCRPSPLFTEGRRHTLIGYEGNAPSCPQSLTRRQTHTSTPCNRWPESPPINPEDTNSHRPRGSHTQDRFNKFDLL